MKRARVGKGQEKSSDTGASSERIPQARSPPCGTRQPEAELFEVGALQGRSPPGWLDCSDGMPWVWCAAEPLQLYPGQVCTYLWPWMSGSLVVSRIPPVPHLP